jgi:hypothetical protein
MRRHGSRPPLSILTYQNGAEDVIPQPGCLPRKKGLFMKLNSKTVVVAGAVLLVLVLSAYFLFSRRGQEPMSPQQAMNPYAALIPPGALMPPQQAMNPYGAFGTPGGAMPDMSKNVGDQAQALQLMTTYHLGPRAANYISQAKLQVLNQSNTSIHFVLSYPDGAKIDETFSVADDPKYTASAADLEKAARSGSKVHGPKLTGRRNGQKEWQYTLQYHLPYSAIPGNLLQKVQSASQNRRGRANFLDFVPSVWAEGGLASGELSVSVLANYFAAYYDGLEMSGRSIGADVPLALGDLADDFLTLRNWTHEIDELADCARNPTNPLAQKATHDPGYQHDVLDPLSDARTDTWTTFVPMLASDTAGFVTHWIPVFGAGAAVGLIFSTQDDAVNEIAENRIEEARRYVVPCDKSPMTPGDLRPMEGVLKYTYVSKPPHEPPGVTDTRTAAGKFELNVVGGGGLKGEGTADYSHEYVAMAATGAPGCQGVADSMKAKGKVGITAGGGGTPLAGVIELRFHGDLPVEEAQMVSEGSRCREQTKNYTSSFGAVCRFQHVDMVHGGTFSTFAEGAEGYGTCTIELSRK